MAIRHLPDPVRFASTLAVEVFEPSMMVTAGPPELVTVMAFR